MTCYDCDGRGWMDDNEFREYVNGEHLGDDAPLFFGFIKTGFTGVCPSCEGFGTEEAPEESDYQTIVIPANIPVALDRMRAIEMYSIFDVEPLREPDMRTGYERLRDWFWKKAHALSERKGYCDGCCC